MEWVVFLVLAALTVLVAALVFIFRSNSRDRDLALIALQQNMMKQMQEDGVSLRKEFSQSLHESMQNISTVLGGVSTQLNKRMEETNTTLGRTQNNVGDRLDNAAKVIHNLQNQLGTLEESSRRMLDIGQGLKNLENVLRNPKIRGNMGEFFLEDLLRQVLPTGSYGIQHSFRSGVTVDAVVYVGDNLLPIDSKFPVESFVRFLTIPDDEPDKKKKEYRAFIATIKHHANDIAKKYICPDENTFDFAFMYIPAENVYYETIIRNDGTINSDSLYSWLLQKKVIPVSPNSLYAYLQVILLGLKGMKIQESAKEILQGLDQLSGDLRRFQSDYSVLGKHIKNAGNTFEGGNKYLEKFQGRYDQLLQTKEYRGITKE